MGDLKTLRGNFYYVILGIVLVIVLGTVIKDESRATAAGWATIAETRFYGEFAKLLVHVFETGGAQSIQYRVQASNDVDFDGVETLEDVDLADGTDIHLGADERDITTRVLSSAEAIDAQPTKRSSRISWSQRRYPIGGPEAAYRSYMSFVPFDRATSAGVLKLDTVHTEATAGAIAEYLEIERNGTRRRIPLHALS